MDRKDLVKVAEEFNDVMGLEPEINPALKAEKLIEKIREAAKELTEADALSKATKATLVEMKVAYPGSKPVEEDDDAPEDDDEEPDDDEEKDLATLLAEAAKLKELKALVEKHDEFKKLRKSVEEFTGLAGPRELKAKMYKALGIEPPVKPEKVKKERGPTKKSVCVEMVSKKGGATVEEMGAAITKAGIDPDTDKNTKTAKLWMAKIGFKVNHNKESGKYTKA